MLPFKLLLVLWTNHCGWRELQKRVAVSNKTITQDLYSCACRIIEIYTLMLTQGAMSPKDTKDVFITQKPLTHKKFSMEEKCKLELRS